jgi:hypothetical protein
MLQINRLNPEYSNPKLHAGVAGLCALTCGTIVAQLLQEIQMQLVCLGHLQKLKTMMNLLLFE